MKVYAPKDFILAGVNETTLKGERVGVVVRGTFIFAAAPVELHHGDTLLISHVDAIVWAVRDQDGYIAWHNTTDDLNIAITLPKSADAFGSFWEGLDHARKNQPTA